MEKVKDMGKCYGKQENFHLYKDKAGFVGVYSVFKEDDGEEYANFRGHLAHLVNFPAVVEELKYEDKIMMQEALAEFGYAQ